MILDSDENHQGFPITLLSYYLAHYMLFAHYFMQCDTVQFISHFI